MNSILSRAYLMLALSLFSFVGLSGIQSLAYVFNGCELSIDFTLEEESESKSGEESEVKCEKEIVNYSFVIQEQNHSTSIAYHNHLFALSDAVVEVATPPPEA